MANAVADRLRNQAEKSLGMSRVYNRRGRVLSGYGGTLGGYTMSLQKNNADKEDQIMQNKYANGEVGIDEMISYLTNTGNRAWLSNEDKKLLFQTIGQMKDKKADADYADKYSSGTITARQYLIYKQQRLAGINAGSPLYDSISTDVEQLKKAAGKEDLNTYFKKEAARISNLGDSTSQYMGYENLYREMSTKANGFGLADEANDYLTKAGEYKIEADKAKETLKTAGVKQEKAGLVDKINLAINSYVNNEITPQDFAGVLDQFQSEAVGGGHTDLLKELNTWSNNTREDIQYGKAWDRGGQRTKGPGVGGGSTVDIYGNLIEGGGGSSSSSGGGSIGYTGGGSLGNGVILPNAGGTPSVQDENKHQSPEIEDATFKESYTNLTNELNSGAINTSQYMEDLALILADRKTDLDYRIGILSNQKPTAKVYYDGVKQKASAVIEKLNKELNDDWTLALGVDAPDYAKVGINDIYNEVSNNPSNLTVVMNQALTTGGFSAAGSQGTPLIVKRLPGMEGDYIADSNGINRKVNLVKSSDVIDGVSYTNLKPDEQKNYKFDAMAGGYQKVNDKYVDIQDKDGQFLRYWLNGDNTVKSVQLNGNEDLNEDYKNAGATGLVPLSVLGKQINDLRKQAEQQTISEQKTLMEKKATDPKQFSLTPADTQKPVLNVGNLPNNNINGNLKIDAGTPLNANQPVTPTVVKPTFATQQTEAPILTPAQNKNFGTNYAASPAAESKIVSGSSTPTQIKASNQAATKLQLASEQIKPIATSTKINFTPQQVASMAPPVIQKKTSLWDKITGLFKR